MPKRPCIEHPCPMVAELGKARCAVHEAELQRQKWQVNPNRDMAYRRAKAAVARQLPIPCSLCGGPITHLGHDRWSLTFDHIVPVSLGGTNELSNLRAAHKHCNSSRGRGRSPAR
jgi:5-methylcytosine-specific restriction endonuclease McrA